MFLPLTSKKILVGLVVYAILSLAVVPAAQACSCHNVIYPKMSRNRLARLMVSHAFRQSDAIFSGEVIRIEAISSTKFDREAAVTIKVADTWKGTLGDQVTVLTPIGCCGCNYEFAVGVEYLVYAYKRSAGLYYTDSCSRTERLSRAATDLKILRALATRPSISRVDGRNITTRWTGAAGACFASNLMRRRLNEFAPPGQL